MQANINGTLLEIRSYEDAAHSVHTQIWSQNDDPLLGSRYPIVGRESRPSIRNIVRLKLGSGVERSFVLTQVRLGAKAASRITLIFPIPIERAMNPVYDYAAIAAIDYAANNCHDYLRKGRQIFVEGRLCTREWEGNGTTGRRTEIIASRVQFLGAPPSDVKAEKPSAEASLVAEAEVPF